MTSPSPTPVVDAIEAMTQERDDLRVMNASLRLQVQEAVQAVESARTWAVDQENWAQRLAGALTIALENTTQSTFAHANDDLLDAHRTLEAYSATVNGGQT